MKTVIILTMPRSGSSLLAGIFHRLGIRMGSHSDLRRGKHLNKHGCYEDQWFQSISLNILLESRILLDLTRRLDLDEKLIRLAVQRYESEIKRFVARRRSERWGFKDPGLAYHLPYSHPHFENPCYVHLTRNPTDTAASWFKTFRSSYWFSEMKEKLPLFRGANRLRLFWRAIGLFVSRQKSYHDPRLFQQVVEKGHERIRMFLQQRDHISVDLHDLLQSPETEIRRLNDLLDMDFPESSLSEALHFIDPKLLHSPQAS